RRQFRAPPSLAFQQRYFEQRSFQQTARGFAGKPEFSRAAASSLSPPHRLFHFDRTPVWIRRSSGPDRASDRRSVWLSLLVRAPVLIADPPPVWQSPPVIGRPARCRRYRPSSFSRSHWTADRSSSP